jgi:hypothetical protein
MQKRSDIIYPEGCTGPIYMVRQSVAEPEHHFAAPPSLDENIKELYSHPLSPLATTIAMSDDSSASTSTIPPVTERARSTAEQQAEDDTIELNNTDLVNDPEEQAAVEAARKKQAEASASRGGARRPQDPFRSRDLNSMDKIAAAFVAKFDKEKAKKAKKYVMVFVNVKGARNTVVQEQAQLASDFRQFEEKEEREARLEREKKAAQRAAEDAETDAPGKKSRAEPEEPVNLKDDYLLVFNESEYTKDFGFWLIVDDWVKDLCRKNSPDWWGRTMDDDEKWLRENYNPIYYGTVTKEGKENKYPQVRLKVAVNEKTGMPMFECKTESKKDLDDKPLIIWRHSDHKETLEEWAKDDAAYFKKHGQKRAANIPLKEMLKLMRRGAVVRFLWNFRGFGYSKGLNKVSNFGYVTKVTIVIEGTGTAPSTDFIED